MKKCDYYLLTSNKIIKQCQNTSESVKKGTKQNNKKRVTKMKI